MTKKITAVASAQQAVADLNTRLETARADHGTAVVRVAELEQEAARIGATLGAGGEGITEDQVMDIRQRQGAATILAQSRARGITQLKDELTRAEHVLMGELIRAEAGGFTSAETLRAEVDAITAELIARLDVVADKADERSSFLNRSITQLRAIDGGGREANARTAIGGVRRRRMNEQYLEVDGKDVFDFSSDALYQMVSRTVESAGMRSSRNARRAA